jgi:hypothetical protein
MDILGFILLSISYLALLSYFYKQAYYERKRGNYLAQSNRDLHAENRYYRERYPN